MEEQKFSFSESFSKAKEYVDTQLELLRLKAISRSSRIGATIILDMTRVLLVLLIVFFMSLALGFFLAELLRSYALGFLATGAIFLVILLIVNSMSVSLERKFMGIIVERIFSKMHDESDMKDHSAPIGNKTENKFEEGANKDENKD